MIVGDGSLRRRARGPERRASASDASCTLSRSPADIADLHHAFDLFVQSSEYEGTPNAVLEAMAMETPIVATDVGGTRELAAHGRPRAASCRPATSAALAGGDASA